MKKVISLFLIAAIICSVFAGCSAEEPKPVSSAESSDSSKNAVSEDKSSQKQEVVATEAPKETTIEETVVYDNAGVKITATGLEESWTGKDIKFLIENTTDRNIAFSGDLAVVNGVTIPAYLYINVAAGKKANGTMSLYTSNLDIAGIEDISTINVKESQIVDTDSYETLTDVQFELVTSLGSEYTQNVDDSGDVLYEANGVFVISKVISGGLFGEEVILLVKNESASDIIAEADNISVNDFTVNGWMYDTVYAGTVRFCEMDIYSSSLEENGITEVENVSFTINIIDANSYGLVAKSDEIQIVVNP